MGCREFRESVVDGQRGGSPGETPGPSWRAHAAECEACGSWLAAEQHLLAGFDVLRQQDADLETPPDLAAALFEEFRNLHAARPPVVAIRAPRWRLWMGAAAAALMVAAWIGLQEPQRDDAPPDSIALVVPDSTAPAQERALSADPGPAAPTRTLEAPERSRPATASHAAAQEQPAPAQPAPAQPASAQPAQIQTAQAQPLTEPIQVRSDTAPSAGPAREQEVATEFVPLTYATWGAPGPPARLVRVRLPSTALAYFGLPGASSSRTVEADVILGENGLVYAVRFVRPAMASLSASDLTNSQALEPY